jgi:hypothetical protein
LRDLRGAGFVLSSESILVEKIRHADSVGRRPTRLVVMILKHLLPFSVLVRLAIGLRTLRRLCTNVVYELCYKPLSPTGSSHASPIARHESPKSAPVWVERESQGASNELRHVPGARIARTPLGLATIVTWLPPCS